LAMADVKIINGEIFKDNRGQISSINKFSLLGMKRFYVIHQKSTKIIRGWHGHKHEQKSFYCIKGGFTIGLVKIDNWDKPSADLKAEIIHLSESDSKIVCVPAGYANCIKAEREDSILIVFSDKLFGESVTDSVRYESSFWVNWDKF